MRFFRHYRLWNSFKMVGGDVFLEMLNSELMLIFLFILIHSFQFFFRVIVISLNIKGTWFIHFSAQKRNVQLLYMLLNFPYESFKFIVTWLKLCFNCDLTNACSQVRRREWYGSRAAAMKSAGVRLEVNLKEHLTHKPLQNANKSGHSETPRWDIQKRSIRGPTKRTYFLQIFLKKSLKKF